MKEKQKNEIKVGLTVLVGLAILITGFFLVKEWSVPGGEYPLLMRFSTSAGLQKGDPVSVNGVKSGRVESVVVDGNSVLVRALIQGSIRLTRDAAATIQMLELMGGKKIEIVQGVSPEPLNVNAILAGGVDPDIAGALGVIGQLRGDIVQLSTNGNALLKNLNAVAGDPAFQSSVKETFMNLNGELKDLRGMVAENRNSARRIAENLDRLTAGLDTLVRDSRPRLTAALDKAGGVMERTDSLFADVRSLLGEMRSGNGILQKAIRDSSFTARIDSAMIKTSRLLDILLDRGMKVRVRL